MKLKILKVKDQAIVPKRATPGAAAMDLYSCTENPIVIKPNERSLVPTGIAIELPSSDTVALVFARSGLAIKEGISLSNAVGVIDSDYRGEIGVGLINLSNQDYTVNNGDRIAQLMVINCLCVEPQVCEKLSESERGTGGFGSTGKN